LNVAVPKNKFGAAQQKSLDIGILHPYYSICAAQHFVPKYRCGANFPEIIFT
jgi:hypothetical protein